MFSEKVSVSFFLFFFLRFYFFPFFPQSPPVHSCIFFVVGPSSCGMWDAASVWFDEQRHVHAQDSNQRNTGPPAAESANSTTGPWGQPLSSSSFKLHLPSLTVFISPSCKPALSRIKLYFLLPSLPPSSFFHFTMNMCYLYSHK